MRFLAIDFETANSQRNSPCEIGLVVVEDFEIVDQQAFLIRPRDNYFDFYNTEIHGIDESMVENEPEFDIIYDKLEKYFEHYPIIAHNAAFDISVLRHTLDLYKIDYPETQYACTYQMSKQISKELLSFRLDYLCDYYEIELDHHRALSDASGCAQLAIQFFKEKGVSKFDEIESVFNLKLGKLFKGGFRGSGKRIYGDGVDIRTIEVDQSKIDENNPFYNKTVVFTGTLKSMARKNAQIRVLENGGKPGKGVTNETDYLVIGDQDFKKFGDGFKSSKIKKAEKLLGEGSSIELLSERQFLEMIV
ncbi:MAG: exonuclease domain-containing protein [bacterium]|uniref:BRCT domain-containing protein n=1 Tax=Phaeodactylibacter xiamenensis TaxID=1524460 RepID=A0A098RXC9_9BACT|nr:exonuclease domain-containing protein [Phaeodactylibacter xiamenensis]KGE84809.1 hypothetical protein IX84_31720 [Phaeodactylibacter xiamenensis]MCR9055374.1 exonuclease domain-containing protein [bacterium]